MQQQKKKRIKEIQSQYIHWEYMTFINVTVLFFWNKKHSKIPWSLDSSSFEMKDFFSIFQSWNRTNSHSKTLQLKGELMGKPRHKGLSPVTLRNILSEELGSHFVTELIIPGENE